MEPQSQQHKEHIQHTFDRYCKKILRNETYDYCNELFRRRKYEKSISELTEQEFAQLSVTDEYFKATYIFDVLGWDIIVLDELIAKALQTLTTNRRDIILLSFFLDMTDKEIAEHMKLVRRTVAYRRASTLKLLKKYMEGEGQTDEKP